MTYAEWTSYNTLSICKNWCLLIREFKF